MAQSKFNHVRLAGLSVVLPPREISIYDEAQYYDNSVKKIDRMRKMVGFYKRRVVDEGVTASDLSIQAAQRLIKEMNVDKNRIDALVYVVQRPDYSRPATAFYIHKKLGLSTSCATFDINQGCPGWLYGLWVAHSMIASGACKRVLLLAGDTPSVDIDPADRISAPVFGDAGTAALLEYNENAETAYFDLGADGGGFEYIITPASGYRCGPRLSSRYANDKNANAGLFDAMETPTGHPARLTDVYMDGIAVFNFTMTAAPASIRRLMDFAGVTERDVDWLMLHQANKQIVETVASKAGFPKEKAPSDSFQNYGNQSVVSIPVSISHSLAGKLTGRERIVCASFGNGLAWASCMIKFDKDMYFSGIMNFEKPADFKERASVIESWRKRIQGKSDE